MSALASLKAWPFRDDLKLQNVSGYNMLQRQRLPSLASIRGSALPLTTAAPRSAFSSFSASASLRSLPCSISWRGAGSVLPFPCFENSSLNSPSSLFSFFNRTSPSSSSVLSSHFACNVCRSPPRVLCTSLFSLPYLVTAVRFKMVKSASYRRPPRASPTGQARKPHIGPRRLSAEYVTPGVVLVKQRKVVAFNLETKRRKRHFKMYPGENVGVTSSTHLVALAHGRVKYTHDVSRDVMIVNVLPERKEELLREDLWRYRTEHVRTVEENRHICFLRMKATRVFPKELVNPPTKPELRPHHFTKRDIWENPTLPDVPIFDDDR